MDSATATMKSASGTVVTDALVERIITLPEQLRRSLTWDHGKEMADLAPFDQNHLDRVAVELNGRPRQTLGWMPPSQALNQVLQ